MHRHVAGTRNLVKTTSVIWSKDEILHHFFSYLGSTNWGVCDKIVGGGGRGGGEEGVPMHTFVGQQQPICPSTPPTQCCKLQTSTLGDEANLGGVHVQAGLCRTSRLRVGDAAALGIELPAVVSALQHAVVHAALRHRRQPVKNKVNLVW